MSNSFYYFFSATPQVLAAILALFGVFVVFKIQTIKTQLTAVGKSLKLLVWDLITKSPEFKLTKSKSTILHYGDFAEALERNYFDKIKSNIELWVEDRLYDPVRKDYFRKYDFLKGLTKSTIKWSIFTAIIIIICLSSIPFGTFFLKHVCILYALYSCVVISIIIIFIGLISILIKAISESD